MNLSVKPLRVTHTVDLVTLDESLILSLELFGRVIEVPVSSEDLSTVLQRMDSPESPEFAPFPLQKAREPAETPDDPYEYEDGQ